MLLFIFSLSCTDYSLYSEEKQGNVESPAPEILVEPSELVLGAICTSNPEKFLIRNYGTGLLTVQSLTVEGEGWTVSNDPTPFGLDEGEIREISVDSGIGEAMLVIQSDDADTPIVNVPLSAESDQPPVLRILNPYDGEILDGERVFLASASDDVDAPEQLLVQWRSNLDGLFSTESASTDGSLEAVWSDAHQSGGHLVQVMVSDSCSNSSSVMVQVCQQLVYEVENLDISTWNFEGTASWDAQNSWVELTGLGDYEAGSAFSTSQTVPGGQVEIEFLFYMSDGTGADGISLTALDVDRMTSFFGAAGGGIGYSGLPGWSLEVDNYYNEGSDLTTEDHLMFSFDGNTSSPEFLVELPDMEDGAWHQMRVVVQEPHILVEIDNVVYVDEDIPGFYGFDAYVGFTAATGALTNYHLIDSLVVSEQVCGD